MEDEFLIRMNAVDMVRAANFDVIEAENADEAILILESRLDITVVFTDIQMPAPWMASSWLPPLGAAGRRSKS